MCAVFAYSRKCSDEDGVGFASLTTLPRPPSGGGSAGGAPPPPAAPQTVPKPLYSPTIRALPVRIGPGTAPLVQLRWVNPVDPQQFALLKTIEWHRDGALIGKTPIPAFQPGAAPTCRSGLVWREAFSGDVVCVPPGRRAEIREENRVGASLRAR